MKFKCNYCKYITERKGDYKKHLTTQKHKIYKIDKIY